uniref:BED-type domain-containing protein n=1 Tax=Steinernema glaseri TaxID=37863 RepID=A0A1I8A455_9BILA
MASSSLKNSVQSTETVTISIAGDKQSSGRKPTASVWAYFERNGDKATCLECNNKLSKFPTTLRNHLKRKHPTLFADCDSNAKQPKQQIGTEDLGGSGIRRFCKPLSDVQLESLCTLFCETTLSCGLVDTDTVNSIYHYCPWRASIIYLSLRFYLMLDHAPALTVLVRGDSRSSTGRTKKGVAGIFLGEKVVSR